MRNVRHPLKISKDLECAQMNTGLDFHIYDIGSSELIGENHGVFLRILGIEVVVGYGRLGVVESIFGRKEVVDSRATVRQYTVGLEKLFHNRKTPLGEGIRRRRLVVLKFKFGDNRLQLFHCILV